jgi:4-hydroxybenzoate polyprenyltransferase
MVFISTTLNDLGDIAGDKIAKRRTIPIVIGEENTIYLTLFLAVSVLCVTLAFYSASVAQIHEASTLSI